MLVVPQGKSDLIVFCESHAPVWAGAAGEIGVAPLQVGEMAAATAAAREAFADAEAARAASRAATLRLEAACEGLRAVAGLLVKAIKLHADNAASPGPVYAAAQIPEPGLGRPGTMPPPGKPHSFSFHLEPGGGLTLRWKSEHSAASDGAYFSVARSDGGDGVFKVVGGGTSRVFTDETIPRGAAGVTYLVTPMRNGKAGAASDMVGVQFGAVGDGVGAVGAVGAVGVGVGVGVGGKRELRGRAA